MKVLVVSNYRDYHTTRPEASIFKGLVKLGVDITIMTYGDSQHAEEFRTAGIDVIDYYPESKRDGNAVKKIRETLIEKEIDIVHLFSSKAIMNGIKAAKGLAVKVVLYRGYTGNIHWYDPTSYLKFLHPRVDKIFCNSKGVEDLINRQSLFNKSKAITINKGHDLRWYEGYEPYDIKGELGLAENSFLFVNVANNRKMKGIPYLLKAFTALPADIPVHLLLVGRDMDTPENKEIVCKAGREGSVHFLGFRKNALEIVAASNCFVLSSIKGESITKSVIEAMSLGLAPVITDIPGNQELVVDGESGLVVPSKNSKALGEAMNRVFQDKPLYKKLGENAKNRIKEDLNYQKTIDKTKKLYDGLYAELQEEGKSK